MALTELKQSATIAPKISEKSKKFISQFTGGPVPEDIRKELEQYVMDMQPILESYKPILLAKFDRIFSQ